MCLTVGYEEILKIADKDITCYKVLEKRSYDNGLTTPFRHANACVGEIYHTELNKKGCRVYEGFHSSATKKSGIDLFNFCSYPKRDVHLVKCVIPKGSEYYKGFFDGDENAPSYASNVIKYVKIVKSRIRSNENFK